jgi:hypothetical protein
MALTGQKGHGLFVNIPQPSNITPQNDGASLRMHLDQHLDFYKHGRI